MTNWIRKENNLVNLDQVTGITVDTQGDTQDHIGTIKFTYETGATTFKYGTMKDPENKKDLEDHLEYIKSITVDNGAWVMHGNKIVNLNKTNGIIIKQNVGQNREGMILFVYIAGGTDFNFGNIENLDNKKALENKVNEIETKLNL